MRSLFLALALCACGRIGFDGSTDASARDGAPDSVPGVIAFAGSFVAQSSVQATQTAQITITAQHATDAMLLHLFCETGTAPTAVTITGPAGWTWTQLTTIASAGSFRGTAFGAVAPDTMPATFTIAWSIGTDTCSFSDEMGDELTMTDPSGGTMTFEATDAGASMTGNCDTTLTTRSANAALWSACTTNCVSAAGAGFTKSSDDGHCDATEYRLAMDPASTPETLAFATTAGTTFVATSVAVRAR